MNGLTTAGISRALGAPLERVEAIWPELDEALTGISGGIPNDRVRTAALATIGVECPRFTPMRELGGAARFVRLYWDNPRARAMLGNRELSDATTYYGRGLIQLTGRDNYQRFGDALGLNLIGDPDLALDPGNAVRIFAHFFHKCVPAAQACNFVHVRELVNGGHNHLADFLAFVRDLASGAGLADIAAAAAIQLLQTSATRAPEAALETK